MVNTVLVDGIYNADVVNAHVNDKGLVLVKFLSHGCASRWIRADRLPEGVAVWASRDQERAFLLRWLADDLRTLGYEAGAILSVHDEQFNAIKSDDPFLGDRGGNVFIPRTAGTHTLDMFHALGFTGSRNAIADRIGRRLAGKSNDQLDALADALSEAWDGDKFDWALVTSRTLARVGLRRDQFRAPMTLPRFDADPGAVVGKYFPEAVSFEEQVA
jgi:hypothetical protein